MSNFIVSARKYRPVRFDEVVGQEHVAQTLKNALRTDHLAHAFLFCGPRGVGKTTCARILAKVLNCENAGDSAEPCNVCSSCSSFNENASFNITELDAASNNSVEHIRALIEQVRFQPQQGQYKVFIIDEVHMLSQQAFNAFLKTLEEPPPYAIFILATTEKHKIIPTILSRCQIFDFKRIQPPQMVAHLQKICIEEQIQADEDALHIIAQKADGALRDALSIFDRVVSFSGKSITYNDVITNLNILDYDYYFKVVDALLMEDVSQVLLIFDDILKKGFDPNIFINGLAEHLRNLLVGKDTQTLGLLEVSETLKKRYLQQVSLAPISLILTALSLANDCDINYKMAVNKRLHVEMTLIKMAYINQAVDMSKGNFASATTTTTTSTQKKTPDVSNSITTKSTPVNIVQEKPIEPLVKANAASDNTKPIKTSGKYAMPQIDMASLTVEATTEQQTTIEVKPLEINNVQQAWSNYIEQMDQPSSKSILRQAELIIEEDKLIVTIGSTLAENTIRQEKELTPYLRNFLQHPNMEIKIVVERKQVTEAPTRPKIRSLKEKFALMKATNPLVDEIRKRFDLNPDKD